MSLTVADTVASRFAPAWLRGSPAACEALADLRETDQASSWFAFLDVEWFHRDRQDSPDAGLAKIPMNNAYTGLTPAGRRRIRSGSSPSKKASSRSGTAESQSAFARTWI